MVGRDLENDIHAFEQFEPAFDGFGIPLQVFRQGIAGNRTSDPPAHEFDECLQVSNTSDTLQIEKVLTKDDVKMALSPAVVEYFFAFKKRFRKSSESQKPFKRHLRRKIRFDFFQIQGMEAVLEKSAGKGIAHLAGGIELRASRHQHGQLQPSRVIDALNPGFPVLHFMEFVKITRAQSRLQLFSISATRCSARS